MKKTIRLQPIRSNQLPQPWNLPQFTCPWATSVGPWALHEDTGDWYKPIAYVWFENGQAHVWSNRVRLSRARVDKAISADQVIEWVAPQLTTLYVECKNFCGHDPAATL